MVPSLVCLRRVGLLVLAGIATAACAQPAPSRGAKGPTHADILRGAYGPFRANNHLLSYHLDLRVNPTEKSIAGKNTIRFRMLEDGNRLQIDLADDLNVDKILKGTQELKYTRDSGAVFIDFPETLRKGQDVAIDFYYSAHPQSKGRFGVFTFGKDPAGRDWIYTACENSGASLWWPNKDQWRDRVEGMEISVEIPNDLVDVSNGKFMGKTDLKDGYTRWDWRVHYPINNYCVALNIGHYVHFSDQLGTMPLDYYVLPEDLEKAKVQFTQVKGMIEAYRHYFDDYPFRKDGYKLIQVPYAGMEHQSAVAYGNGFKNGYYGNDWTGVGISPRFDFIIIHESGHEWFGNSVAAADQSDMWIHEGWTTYLECLYVEFLYGKADALKYTNGLKPKVRNRTPVVAERGVNALPSEDMYFKGALMLNTLRSVINDDRRWFALIKDFYRHFKYHAIMTEQVVAYFNDWLHADLTPIFNEYLHHAALPTLDLKFSPGEVAYRWDAEEPGFNMPIKVGDEGKWEVIKPTSDWKTLKTPLGREEFKVATNLYYVKVDKQ